MEPLITQLTTELARGKVFLLALITGLAVSAIYLIQPILHSLSLALLISPEKMGLVMTLTQIGYGLGILLLIPLGDVLPKKQLIFRKLICLSVVLFLTGFSKNFWMILFGSLAIGIFGTTAQDVVPFAADLAPEKSRGSVVGQVMSGLLLGILLSRTASGVVSDLLGWRWVYWSCAILIASVAILFQLSVAAQPAKSGIKYGDLLKSTLKNFILYPSLRNAIYSQGLLAIAFSAFWTNLSFFLGNAPFFLSNTQIGLFGLAGAVGALVAPIAGKLSDRRGAQTGINLGTTIVVLAFAIMSSLSMSMPCLIVGTVLFDLGIQMALISHQSNVYALNPLARARLNALFVCILFIAFAFGSFVSVRIQVIWGWSGVLYLCLACAALSLFNVLRTRTRR